MAAPMACALPVIRMRRILRFSFAPIATPSQRPTPITRESPVTSTTVRTVTNVTPVEGREDKKGNEAAGSAGSSNS